MSSPTRTYWHRDRPQHRAHNEFQEELTNRYRIGTKIRKTFEDGHTYEGEIVSYRGQFYQIYYSANNDSEDMDHSEVRKYSNINEQLKVPAPH